MNLLTPSSGPHEPVFRKRTRTRGTAHHGRRGVAVVELAVLLPLLVFLFVVTVDFARVYYFSLTLQNCARAGAMYASDPRRSGRVTVRKHGGGGPVGRYEPQPGADDYPDVGHRRLRAFLRGGYGGLFVPFDYGLSGHPEVDEYHPLGPHA